MKAPKSIPTQVPTAPKGAGISRRLLFSLLGLLCVVGLLFVFFLQHYSHHQKFIDRSGDEILLSTNAASNMIRKLEHRQYQGAIADQDVNSNVIAANSEMKRLSSARPKFSDNDFKMAGNANILVYHSDRHRPHGAQSTRSSVGHQAASSPYTLRAGTIIPATLLTGINSDLPGTILAKTRQDVFDTVTGNYLLIPQGTTLMGLYDSHMVFGQSRVTVVWSRLIFPNGSSIDLKRMPGVDLTGMSGLHDLVDHHYLRIFGSSLLFSIFSAANQLSLPQNADSQLSSRQILDAAMSQQLSQTGMQWVGKNMNIQATNKIRPGTNFNVLLTRDMVFSGPYRFWK